MMQENCHFRKKIILGNLGRNLEKILFLLGPPLLTVKG